MLAAIVGLALLDSLNVFSLAAQAYLLGSDRPFARGAAFTIGTFAVYAAGGAALAAGWAALLRRLLPLVPPWLPGAAEAAAGAALAAYAWHLFRRARAGDAALPAFVAPAHASVAGTLAFAMVATAGDVSTAVPYVAAIHRVVTAVPDGWARAGWLLLYNVLYVLPLVAMLAARAWLGARSRAPFGRLRDGVDRAIRAGLPYAAALGAAALLGDGVRRLLAAPPG